MVVSLPSEVGISFPYCEGLGATGRVRARLKEPRPQTSAPLSQPSALGDIFSRPRQTEAQRGHYRELLKLKNLA